MITLEAISEAWAAASKAADAKRATWIRVMWRSCEYLVPLTDDRPVLIRCRVCSSIEVFALGPADSLPDANQSFHMHAVSPCGMCRSACLPAGWNLLGIREAHAAGKTVGIGGKAIPGKRPEPVEESHAEPE